MGCSGDEVSWSGYIVEYSRITGTAAISFKKLGTASYFFFKLRNLRSYNRTRISPIILNTSKVVNVNSMFVISAHLHAVYNKTYNKQYYGCNKSNPQCSPRELVGYNVSDDCKPYYKLTYIIAILGEVVYLLLFQHGNIKRAMAVP